MFDDLVDHFGEDGVFMDVAGIAPGRDFRAAIDESVSTCGALLAVIGPLWASQTDENERRRLDDEDDFVRLEIANALKRDVPVIPVLVRGSKMPRPGDLPENMRELVFRNAVAISHAKWRQDVAGLIDALQRILSADGAPALPAGGRPASADEPSAAVDPATARHIARALAHYIGPVADVVVKRAARRCSSAKQIYEAVALEIEKPADRAAFLRSREH